MAKPIIAEMNVVPYIDVMLVLLVIFMATAPIIMQGVKVDLPKTRARSLATTKQVPIIVTVNKAGTLFLNINDKPNESITSKYLSIRIAAEHQRNPERAILVKGDTHVDYGQVVGVMAMLQNVGVKNVGLITESAST